MAQEEAFDSISECVAWAMTGRHYSIHRIKPDPSYTPRYMRGGQWPDVSRAVTRCFHRGEITHLHVKLFNHFMDHCDFPGAQHGKQIHDMWQEILEAIGPELEQKGLVHAPR